jgi:hypothetical protein
MPSGSISSLASSNSSPGRNRIAMASARHASASSPASFPALTSARIAARENPPFCRRRISESRSTWLLSYTLRRPTRVGGCSSRRD